MILELYMILCRYYKPLYYVHSITQGKGSMITWWLVGRGNYQGSNRFIDDDKSYQERVKYVKSLTDLQLNNSQSDKSRSHPNVLLNL